MEWLGVTGAAVGFFSVFLIKRIILGKSSTSALGEDLILLVDSDKLKGRAKQLKTKMNRYLNQQGEVRFAARFAVEEAFRELLVCVTLMVLFFVFVGFFLQPYLVVLNGLPLFERVYVTANVLFLGLLDALSFDLFAVFGIDMKPQLNAVQGRIILWSYYFLSASLLVQASLAMLANLWSALVALLLPEPTLRLLREKSQGYEPSTPVRRLINLVTLF